MPNDELTQEVIDVSLRLISASPDGDIDGGDVARELSRPIDDIDLYYAFREAVRRGVLVVPNAWRGGMGLPGIVRLPTA